MKNFRFNLLVLLLSSFFVINDAQAQCPGCVVNTNCSISPAFPAICPDSLPDGMVGATYDEDITFWMPRTFQVTDPITQNVQLNWVKILDITGLPFGVNWQSNSPNDQYTITPGNEHGCVKLCGNPVLPGVFNITVYVEVNVDPQTIGGNTTQQETFILPITILPDSNSAGSGFSMSQSIGCGSLSVDFINEFPSQAYTPIPGVTSGYSYSWNFGNGNQSTLENPITQNYNTPGNYPVTYTAVLDTFGFFLEEIIVNGVACTDGVFAGNPDLYLELYDGNGTKILDTSNDPDDSNLPTSWQMNIPLTNPPYFLQVWDDDGILCDDNCVTNNCNDPDGIDIVFPSVNSFGTTTLVGQNGGLILQYVINKPVIQIDGTDTVRVFPRPVPPVVSLNPDTLFSCFGDSISLSVDSIYSLYQWYDDTTLMAGFNKPEYLAGITGEYYIEVTNEFGCKDTSSVFNINVNPQLPFPTFYFNSNNELQTNFTNFDIQWLFEGNPIPGENGATLKPETQGNHQLQITDQFGCKRLSNEVFVFVSSNENVDLEKYQVKVYPNPNNGIFNLEIHNLQNEKISLMLTDLAGRKIYEENLSQNNNNVLKNLDFSHLSSGMYMINIYINDNVINQRMVIK